MAEIGEMQNWPKPKFVHQSYTQIHISGQINYIKWYTIYIYSIILIVPKSCCNLYRYHDSWKKRAQKS